MDTDSNTYKFIHTLNFQVLGCRQWTLKHRHTEVILYLFQLQLQNTLEIDT
jgi:hypothetical protein